MIKYVSSLNLEQCLRYDPFSSDYPWDLNKWPMSWHVHWIANVKA